MSYKNDHLLTISNKYGKINSEAKAMVFETYDQLRDLTISGSGIGGTSAYGNLGKFFIGMSKLIGPSSYMPLLGSSSINIPGSSYSSPITGGYSSVPGAQSAFGMGTLGTFPGLPTGGASSAWGIGALGASALSALGSFNTPLAGTFGIGGMPTGAASNLTTSVPGGSTYIPGTGALTGISAATGKFTDITLPVASVVGGVGGLLSHLAPYFGPSGVVAALAGNLMNGYSSAAVSSYQYVSNRVLTNADSILTMKVKNLETTVKQLNAQSDIIKKMLKSSIESDSKAANDL